MRAATCERLAAVTKRQVREDARGERMLKGFGNMN